MAIAKLLTACVSVSLLGALVAGTAALGRPDPVRPAEPAPARTEPPQPGQPPKAAEPGEPPAQPALEPRREDDSTGGEPAPRLRTTLRPLELRLARILRTLKAQQMRFRKRPKEEVQAHTAKYREELEDILAEVAAQADEQREQLEVLQAQRRTRLAEVEVARALREREKAEYADAGRLPPGPPSAPDAKPPRPPAALTHAKTLDLLAAQVQLKEAALGENTVRLAQTQARLRELKRLLKHEAELSPAPPAAAPAEPQATSPGGATR